jgi:hypothetical protein
MRSFSKERARDSKISFPLTAARGDRERKREKERDFSRTLPLPFFPLSGFYPQRARALGKHENLTNARSFLSFHTLHTQKKKSYRMSK